MLIKYARLFSPDANTDGSSSTPSDDKGQDSSTETQQDVQDQDPEGSPNEDGEDTDSDGEPSPEDTGNADDSSDAATGTGDDQTNALEQDGALKEPEQPVLTDKPEDSKLPFHKHTRFQELVKEKNETRTQLEALKPQAERIEILDSYLNTHGIQPSEFTQALNYLRLIRSNPQEALTLMRPTYELLMQMNGEKLPTDLEAKVASGVMEPETAREMARLRATTVRQNQTTVQNEQVAAQQHEYMINSGFSAWDTMKRGIDPGFRPKTAPTNPDGKWEMVNAKLLQLRMERPPRNTREAQQLCQESYDLVSKALAQFAPQRPVTRKPVGSARSNNNSNPVIKTPEDAVKAILAGRRPNELRYA